MKVGFITHSTFSSQDSLNTIFGGVVEVLRRLGHEVIFYGPEFVVASRDRKRELVKELLLSSDVVLGAIDDMVLQVREATGRYVPYVCFLNGSMSRGAPNLITIHHLFKTTDVLVGNCTGDVDITNKFFTNALTRLLPFTVDEDFYRPLDEASRLALKTKLGFGAEEKILLYSGRLTLEKNVHTLLRVFSVLRSLVPESRLVIVGAEYNDPFPEFGIIFRPLDNDAAGIRELVFLECDWPYPELETARIFEVRFPPHGIEKCHGSRDRITCAISRHDGALYSRARSANARRICAFSSQVLSASCHP